MTKNTRDLLHFLFEESQTGHAHPFEAPGKDAELPKLATRDDAEDSKAVLVKILTKLGLDNVADRLEWTNGEFWLCGGKSTHACDSSILGDINLIEPLIDAGFAVIDGEVDEDGKYRFAFICADREYVLDAEGGVSDLEKMQATPKLTKEAKPGSDDIARNLIERVLKSAAAS